MFNGFTKEEAQQLIKEITGPRRVVLGGEEYTQMLVILRLLEPTYWTNNQHTFTDVYHYNNKTYHVIYVGEDPPIIEELDS